MAENEGTSELAAALSETPDTTVILNLGVNDITEADAYISYYKQLFDSYPDTDFHIMSVNPVSDDCPTVTNAAIDAFNQKIKAAFPDEYLDVYNYLLTGDFSTVDGLHYTDSTLSFHSLLFSTANDCRLIVRRLKRFFHLLSLQNQTVRLFSFPEYEEIIRRQCIRNLILHQPIV